MGFTTAHSHGDGVCKIPDTACAAYREQQRILSRLIELDAIRRDALGDLVAYNTHGTEVIYLTGIEGDTE